MDSLFLELLKLISVCLQLTVLADFSIFPPEKHLCDKSFRIVSSSPELPVTLR